MPSVKYYYEKTNKSGRTVFAFNPSPALRKLGFKFEPFPTSDAAQARAIEVGSIFAEFKRTGILPSTPDAHSVVGLIDLYKSTSAWRRITRVENSHRTYDQHLRSITDLLGSTKADSIDAVAAEQIYQDLCERRSLGQANAIMRMLSVLWNTGVRLNAVPANPFSSIGLLSTPERNVEWKTSQVHQFVSAADNLQLSSVGTLVLIAYELCQRPGDCRQLTWSTYKDGLFTFTQQKTGTLISDVPVTDILRARLDTIQSNRNPDQPIVVYERTGEPYKDRQLRKKAALVREAAGLPSELKVADLRRSGATLLGNAGATEDEIRSVTGHKSRQVLNRYVRPSRKMAESAQQKRQSFTNEEVLYGST
jgi:integrase